MMADFIVDLLNNGENMNKDILVSIVIPAYNAQDTIHECVRSVSNQTYDNIEIIIVNDGSSDDTQAECERLKETDDRIVVINQKNQGQAVARKVGTMASHGQYQMYVDADDVVDLLCVEKLMAQSENVDWVIASCYRQERDGHMTKRINAIGDGNYQKEDMPYFRDNMIFVDKVDEDGILPYMVAKLYRTELVKEIMMEISDQIGVDEDRLFNWCYAFLAESVSVINESEYTYKYNENSIMHSLKMDYLSDLNEFYLCSRGFFDKHKASCVVYDKLERFVVSRLNMSPQYLGFSWRNRCIQFYPTIANECVCGNIIIYGAGKVGVDYYRVLRKQIDKTKLRWTDRRWEKLSEDDMPVESPDNVFALDYDLVILAAKYEWMANQMRQELTEKGIIPEKIWWKPPILLRNL